MGELTLNENHMEVSKRITGTWLRCGRCEKWMIGCARTWTDGTQKANKRDERINGEWLAALSITHSVCTSLHAAVVARGERERGEGREWWGNGVDWMAGVGLEQGANGHNWVTSAAQNQYHSFINVGHISITWLTTTQYIISALSLFHLMSPCNQGKDKTSKWQDCWVQVGRN